MAVTKVASVKLDLDGGNYTTSLKRVGDQTEREGKRAAKAFQPLNAGLGRMTRDFGAMGSKLKGMLGTALTFGGAFTFGAMIKGAVDLNGHIQQFTDRMSIATGKAMDWRDVQQQLQEASEDTRKSQEELMQVAESVFASTGNAEYSLEILKSIGRASQVTGADMNALGEAGQLAFRKFGVTAEEFSNEILPGLVEKLAGGGLKAEDLSGKFALLATEAESLGFKGGKGFVQLLGLAKEMDNELGESLVPGMKRLGEVLKSGTSQIRSIQGMLKKKRLDIDVNLEGIELLREIISKGPEGIQALQQSIRSPEARRTIDELIKPFDKAFKEAQEAGETPAEASKAGLDAFDKRMFSFGKTTETAETLLERFNKRLQSDPALAFDHAMNQLKQTFQQPEMMEAVNSLAQNLPVFAEGLADVIDFMMKNPLTTASLAIGGQAALSFGTGVVSNAAAAFAAKAFGRTAASGAGEVAGKALANTAAPGLGRAGTVFARAAGPLMAAAVAFALGSELGAREGKRFADPVESAAQTKLDIEEGNLSQTEKFRRLARFKRTLSELESEEPGVAATALGGISKAIGGKSAEEARQDAIRSARGAIEALETSVSNPNEKSIEDLQKELSVIADRMGTLATKPGDSPAAASSGPPAKVQLIDEGKLAETLAVRMARHLPNAELRVRVMNQVQPPATPPGSAPPASRGPMPPGTPTPSGGTGGA